MLCNEKKCQGQYNILKASTRSNHVVAIQKKIGSLKNAIYHLKNGGCLSFVKLVLLKINRFIGFEGKSNLLIDGKRNSVCDETLNLRPGDLVEVKSEQEIWDTLNLNRQFKGLYFMRGMREFCGKRLRVYKRVDKILLESNGEFRKIKNTVLLENAICDGEERCGCDRSCFYFWKEAWLRKIQKH